MRPTLRLLMGLLLFELVAWSALQFEMDRQVGLASRFWLIVAAASGACLVVLLSAHALIVRRGWFTLKEFLVCVLVIGGICGWIGHVYRQKREQRRIAQFLMEKGALVDWSGGEEPGLEQLIGPEYFYDVEGFSVTTNCSLSVEELAVVRSLEEMNYIHCYSASITDDHLKPLAGVRLLRDMYLCNSVRCTGAGLAHFRGHSGLEELVLEGNWFDEHELVHLQHIPNLTRLHIAFPISATGMAHLGRCKSLKTLLLDDASGEGLEHLTDLPRLADLTIYSNAIADGDLAPLADMHNLTSLHVYASITDEGIEHISQIKNLEHLTLTTPSMTPKGIDAIESMKRLTSVQFPQRGTALLQRVVELRARRPDLRVSN